ncbi:ribonuclease J [Rathayibacter iranicus]|uniref:Ribonuclease J n=2 Tax=Rathayibacter iranicus TaxID=59737 RepID=A0AAD2JFY9_9MICO|nr:ribonuclease J [Rathayibacter iranicus]AZZ54738.1 ribonuclease J [Rathayibacter iranicus]MWV30530.1 RNase J family beta-CASP ribonuclease [Rathayibacter iranicus NCPPB 2253 = VKM Ac-1602]PPI50995.1 RNase J family beta-CASP ribonuclease [Rathayibacter iranicus]PPI62935.1 RNase J family beta-CASP ribonuclease [Rathayibacter iranicus]PPI74227.1 RNase J family beta-CASP ribonuclease [Rathayibacter iranicus]
MPSPVITPAPLQPGTLRIIPLGGLGEIGRNMTIFEIDGKILVIDCGVLFPEENQPGVDLILPDFSPIKDRLDDIVGVVLTHGHEDHIGAVPYLLRLKRDIPLIGSTLTLALVEAKLKEHRIKPYTLAVKEGDVENLGPFELEFVAVNHSIPDALAVAIVTDAGSILHTGDFKMDQLPLDGRITDLRAFARLDEEGIDLLLVDSTNADVPGFTPNERDIGPVIESVMAKATRRVIVASFSSHVHRVQQVLDAAHATGRRVALLGRSMVRNMGIAADLGYLRVPQGVLIDMKKAGDIPEDEIVYMSTGSQGEPMAVLSRMANLDHHIEPGEGDTVILASSLIPGNENAVYRVINGLTKLGATVVHKGTAKVHVSGHAAAGELIYCYNILKPLNVMPVHGEYRHLVANAKLARETGIAEENTIIAEDGTVIDLLDGTATVVGQLDLGFVYVDGSSVGEITDADLKDRRILGEEGFISIIVVVEAGTGRVVVGPEIHAKGFAEDDRVFDEVKPRIAKALEEAVQNGASDQHALSQAVRRVVGRWVNISYRRRPMIVPLVIEA